MNTTIKNFSKVLLVAITIFSMTTIASCSKDGEPGKDGSNGTNGQTGTANVIYSNWINQNWNGENGSISKSMIVPEPKVTSEIINKGFVLGFFRFSDQTFIYNLPFSNSGIGVNIKREFGYNLGSIFFYASRYDNTFPMQELNLNGSATSIPQCRYIVIPGGVSTSGRLMSAPDYTKMSYKEICAKFNIPE